MLTPDLTGLGSCTYSFPGSTNFSTHVIFFSPIYVHSTYLKMFSGRQWMYQTCTEFGFYQTSSGESEVFGDHFNIDFFIQQCQDIFGSK